MLWISTLFLWFITYSFIGWIYESTVISIQDKKLVNRGFFNGPYIPVYGVGGIAVILILGSRTMNIASLFVLSALITTSIEYITAIIMEKGFKTKLWDYTNYRFNFQGRVCLIGAVAFGTLCVLLIKVIHPFISGLTDKMTDVQIYIASAISCAVFLADFVYSFVIVLNLKGKINQITNRWSSFVEAQKNKADDMLDEFYQKNIKEFFSRGGYQTKRLIQAFPRMRFLRNNETFEKLRDRLMRKR